MSIESQQEQDDKVREDLNMQRLLRCMRGTGPRATGIGVRFFHRAGAVTPIPTRCRFSCIAYLAPAIAPSSCSS